MQGADEGHQRPGPLRKLEAIEQLLPLVEGTAGAGGQAAADHVTDMQLGQLVAREVEAGKPLGLEIAAQRRRIGGPAHLHADEQVGQFRIGQAIAELGEAALAQQTAEAAQAARLLRDLHGQQRFALFSQFGPFGHEEQPIEIHVGATGHRHQGAALELALLHILLHAGNCQGPGRLQDRAGVFKDVLDGGADLVGVHRHHRIHVLLGQSEGEFPHLTHGHPIGKQPHLVQPHPFAAGQRAGHGIGIDRLHPDHLDQGPEALDVGSDAGDQATTAHGHIDGIRRL